MFIKPPTEHHVISSPLEGHLLDDGKPMVNTKIIRKLEWNGDKEGVKEDVIYTDEAGFFSFPVFELDMAMRGLEQFVAKTWIYVEDKSEEQELIWYSAKQSLGLFSELGINPENLVCDIKNPEIVTEQSSKAKSQILTRCRWAEMPLFLDM